MKATPVEVEALRREMGMATFDKRLPSEVVNDAVKMLEKVQWSNSSVHEILDESVAGERNAVCAIGAIGLGVGLPLIKKGEKTIAQAAMQYNRAASPLVRAALSSSTLAKHDIYEDEATWLVSHNDEIVGGTYDSGSIRGKRRVQRRLCTLARKLRAKGY